MRWRLLVHPYFTGSVLVLAVNDHLLKGLGSAPFCVGGVFGFLLLYTCRGV